MSDTCVDSLAIFSDSLKFQTQACEISGENKFLKITKHCVYLFSFCMLTTNSFQQIYLIDIFSKLCEPNTLMTKYKFVIVPFKCENVSERD